MRGGSVLKKLQALIRSNKHSRHVSGMSDAQVPNALERDFCGTVQIQKWATDVNKFNANGNKLNLSACITLYNGKIIAHQGQTSRLRVGC